jgi:hypothetical protein
MPGVTAMTGRPDQLCPYRYGKLLFPLCGRKRQLYDSKAPAQMRDDMVGTGVMDHFKM